MNGDLDPTEMAKRSVVIAGHKTSVSLEHAFWLALKQAAARRGITVNSLVTEIDDQRRGNLSSAIRVFLLSEPPERLAG
jgi:predicted DNA-binding ribbon-helix-helix protein